MKASATWIRVHAARPVLPTSGTSKYVSSSPVGDVTPSCHFLRKQTKERSCTADAPAIPLERCKRDASLQQRRNDRPRVRRIIGEDTTPRAGELDQFVAYVPSVASAETGLLADRVPLRR
jgi:hypothetical protein